jgi:hypothetical protein
MILATLKALSQFARIISVFLFFVINHHVMIVPTAVVFQFLAAKIWMQHWKQL